MLKNIRIKTEHNKKEFKITGISELPCNQQLYVNYASFFFFYLFLYTFFLSHHITFCALFLKFCIYACRFNMKVRNSDGKSQMVEVTVYDYFRENHNIELTWSAYAPCLDVGKPTRPNYLPVEVYDI